MACSVEVLGKEEELVEVVVAEIVDVIVAVVLLVAVHAEEELVEVLGKDVAVDLVVLLAEGWLVRNGMASQHSPPSLHCGVSS